MKQRFLTEEMLSAFFTHLAEEERSKVTIEKYRRDLSSFCRFIGESSVTKELVIDYKQQLLSDGYAERSVNSMLAAINSLLAYLGWYELRVKSIKLSPEIYRPENRELTQKEYESLVSTATARGNERLAVILQTICGTGIRISELQFFTVEAISKGEVKVKCKGKTRKVFVVNALKRLLLGYAKKRGIKSGSIFLSKNGVPVNRTVVWREMKQLCAAANVEPSKVFPHNLRHLFARVFYKIEKDIAKLADILGHSNINTTRIYIISTGREHKRKMEKMGLIFPMRI